MDEQDYINNFDIKKITNKGRIDAERFMKKLLGGDPKYNCTYRSTNENLSYLKEMDLKNKTVLCVGASGDQYLESELYNPESVELFDINLISYYYCILKITGLKVLSLKDYQRFFMTGKTNGNIFYNEYFDYNIYLKIRKYLSEDIKTFWDYMYQYECDRLMGIYNKALFYANLNLFECVGKLNYLKEYKSLQKKLEKKPLPKFYVEDIVKLADILNKKYDRIITSNIDDYANVPWFYFVGYKLNNLLNENGIIQTCYKWYPINEIPSDFEELKLERTRNDGSDFTLKYKKNSGNNDGLVIELI